MNFKNLIKNCPDNITAKALKVIKSGARPKKLRNQRYQVLEIDRRHRVVIEGDCYTLMTHERYNKYINS